MDLEKNPVYIVGMAVVGLLLIIVVFWWWKETLKIYVAARRSTVNDLTNPVEQISQNIANSVRNVLLTRESSQGYSTINETAETGSVKEDGNTSGNGAQEPLQSRNNSTGLFQLLDTTGYKQSLRCTDEVYKMSRNPRGTCVIINNSNFGKDFPVRWGSEVDVDRAKRLFSCFHFDVKVAEDLSAVDMKRLLRQTAQDESQHKSDCLVVVMMSHGSDGWILGVDGQMIHVLNDVCEEFSNVNCQALQGKPKLFFIQACQGRMTDTGHPILMDKPDTAYSIRIAPHYASEDRTPSWSDIFLAEATIPDHTAQRNAINGSWFVKAVYEVFWNNAYNTHLVDMMELVGKQLMKTTNSEQVRQTPNFKLIGWRKKLYFRPNCFD
ncbi:caspase-3-like [Haemaphysalis longicornis]